MLEMELYKRWVSQDLEDSDLKEELAAITDDVESIKDRFYKDLEFGTAGLRGVIGAGTNRMNIYVIRRATQGFADYINAKDVYKRQRQGDRYSAERAGAAVPPGFQSQQGIYPRPAA